MRAPFTPLMLLACRWLSATAEWRFCAGAALRLLALLVAFVFGGCASLPAPAPLPPSHAASGVDSTWLGQVAARSRTATDDGRSGFRLLADGTESLDVRLALIGRAEQAIDAQYYLIASDRSGLQFLAALRAAAARGVRVRLLVDDLNAGGQDALFASLAAVPGIEVRLFNPLPVRGGRFAARVALSLHELARINHRMHNKLLVVDGSFAISGGRNIGDAYFDRGGDADFIDMDVLSSGPVVAELGTDFDAFWNSPHAWPIGRLVRGGAAPMDAPSPPLPSSVEEPPAPPLPFAAELASGRLALRFAPARALVDGVARISARGPASGDSAVMAAHLALVSGARSSVLIASPYFVPGRGGLAALRGAASQGVEAVVVTNSLSTTDEPLAHFGYARYRLALLRLGVALHELMPLAAHAGGDEGGGGSGGSRSGSPGRLHAKLVVVDDRWLSIGSMNMDRRSARWNTESALLIDSPELAAEARAFFGRGRAAASYRLRLDAGGHGIEWQTDGGAALREEPQPAGGLGLRPRLASFFVSEEWL